MEQLYLFFDETHRQALQNYEVPEGVTKTISEMDEKKYWTARFAIRKENLESAKMLSGLDKKICSEFTPSVLVSDSSAYFNKKLYPLVNDFERNLRCLLYRKNALSNNQKAQSNLQNLEKMSLGDVFDLLFTDTEFIKNCKSKVNEKNWNYSKKQIIACIKNIEEHVLWDELLGEKIVPKLRDDYENVRLYRNDVMHAHNIHYSEYKESQSLFETVNKQLRAEIGKIISYNECETSEEEKKRNDIFIDILHSAIERQSVDALVEAATGGIPSSFQIQEKLLEEMAQAKFYTPDLEKIYSPYDIAAGLARVSENQSFKAITCKLDELNARINGMSEKVSSVFAQEKVPTYFDDEEVQSAFSDGAGIKLDKLESKINYELPQIETDFDKNE